MASSAHKRLEFFADVRSAGHAVTTTPCENAQSRFGHVKQKLTTRRFLPQLRWYLETYLPALSPRKGIPPHRIKAKYDSGVKPWVEET